MAYNISVADSILVPRSDGSSFNEDTLVLSGTGAVSISQTPGSATFVIDASATPLVVKKDDGSLGNVDTIDFGEYITASVAGGEAEITLSGVVDTTKDQTVGGNKNFTGNMIVGGDLTVNGTTTTLNTTELLVEDNMIVINVAESGSPTLSCGFEIERGSADNAFIFFNEDGDLGPWGDPTGLPVDRFIVGTSGALDYVLVSADLTAYSGVADGLYVNVDGDTMTDFLTLHADPTASGHAATKQYVDAQDAALSGALAADLLAYSGVADGKFVDVAGDTMTGDLTLPGIFATSGTLTNVGAGSDSLVNRAFVEAQVASAAIAIYEDGQVLVNSSAKFIEFGTGVLATLSSSGVIVSVDESQITSFVSLTASETISGTKTFDSPVILAQGTAVTSGAAAGTAGEVRWADDYLYLHTGAEGWKRVALASFD